MAKKKGIGGLIKKVVSVPKKIVAVPKTIVAEVKPVVKTVANVAGDYGKLIVESGVKPLEFVTQKEIYDPKFKTEIGAKVGQAQTKISSVTIPIAAALLPPPAAKAVQTVQTASALIPAKIPVEPLPVAPLEVPVQLLPETASQIQEIKYDAKVQQEKNQSNFAYWALGAAAIGAGVLFMLNSKTSNYGD